MRRKLLAVFIAREVIGLLVMAAALFLPAGDLAWWQGWAALGVMLFYTLGTLYVILFRNHALLAERLGPRRNAKKWDAIIMGLLGLLQLARYLVAGFDHRYAWSAGFSSSAQLITLGVSLLGYSLFLWAMDSNPWFSQVVRLQTDKDQRVAQAGPYRFVRHPGYLGVIPFEILSCVILGSWWAVVPGAACAILLILRTALEDRTLRSELPGYSDYALKVRWRLLAGVW